MVLCYALGTSAFARIFFGLVPALRVTRHGLSETLNGTFSGSFGALLASHPRRLKNWLVAGEISLAFVLVVGSALALRSFSNLLNVRLGFRPAHVLTMYVDSSPAVRANRNRYQLAVNKVLRRTRALPGIESSAFGEWLPIGGSPTVENLTVEGSAYSGPVECQVVSPGYFSTLGIPLFAGRSFNQGDTRTFAPVPAEQNAGFPSSRRKAHSEKQRSSSAGSTKSKQGGPPLVAVVSESFAKKFFDGNALGKEFRAGCLGGNSLVQIVGEVGDARDWTQRSAAEPEAYTPVAQTEGFAANAFLVRTSADPMAMAPALRRAIWSVDNNAPITDLLTMYQLVALSVSDSRYAAILLGSFGALGLILAMVEIYGVISYAVTQRTREFGVRSALGAQPENNLRMVIREGMLLVVAGIAIGIGGALALGRVLQSLLFEVKPTDPPTFIGVATALALVALVACYIPARRAMKVDPMDALRHA
jgi:putative ABC transport system permease protein